MVRRAFDILGIEITKDTRAIKKAYALLSKQYHPEEHPAEWEKLYGAYQAALEYAQTAGELPENEYGNGSSGKGGAATGTAGEGFAGGGGSG
ncbi:MAG: DnaJ domain-containing protein, partial [Schaedlerella sp.]|uniref:J domain-containing protein n=1 Tax=Schaedlerella sp. TaxID=2676057 RepID=UPI0035296857